MSFDEQRVGGHVPIHAVRIAKSVRENFRPRSGDGNKRIRVGAGGRNAVAAVLAELVVRAQREVGRDPQDFSLQGAERLRRRVASVPAFLPSRHRPWKCRDCRSPRCRAWRADRKEYRPWGESWLLKPTRRISRAVPSNVEFLMLVSVHSTRTDSFWSSPAGGFTTGVVAYPSSFKPGACAFVGSAEPGLAGIFHVHGIEFPVFRVVRIEYDGRHSGAEAVRGVLWEKFRET